MSKIQWHPAFCGATEWELKDNKNDLIFEREYNLSKKPLQMDMLVIKKQAGSTIKNEIGKIFRGHNIIEFKGEGDSLSIDDFYKVLGYACIYKSLGDRVNKIASEDISITIIRNSYPMELFKILKSSGINVENAYAGIYYLTGNILFPIQIIVARELDSDKHSSLRILTSNAEEKDIRKFLTDARLASNPGDLHNIDAVLQVSVTANRQTYDKVRGDDTMCQALRELMKDEIEKEVQQAVNQAVKKETAKSADATKVDVIKNVMKNLKLPAEKAMEIVGIEKGDFSKYMSML